MGNVLGAGGCLRLCTGLLADVAVSVAVTDTHRAQWQGPTESVCGSRSPRPHTASTEVGDRHDLHAAPACHTSSQQAAACLQTKSNSGAVWQNVQVTLRVMGRAVRESPAVLHASAVTHTCVHNAHVWELALARATL